MPHFAKPKLQQAGDAGTDAEAAVPAAMKPLELPRQQSALQWPGTPKGGDEVPMNQDGVGPRIQAWVQPVMARAMTAMSWKSDQTGQESESSAKKATLTRGSSRISFTSWKSSGSSSAKSSNASSGRGKQNGKVVEANIDEGERSIKFSADDTEVLPAFLNEIKKGLPNKVRTAKYTWITWLPKSLYYQFKRVANIYFLCIVVLVMFPWSPKDWRSKVGPFTLVLLWTALKDLHEDSRRRRDDALENNQEVVVFDVASKKFTTTTWKTIKVGDVVLVQCDHAFPSDLVLLYADGGHEAFISTISLDGESNLKERRPPPSCSAFKPTSGEAPPEDHEASAKHDELAAACKEALVVMHQIHLQGMTLAIGRPEVVVSDVRGTLCTSSGHPSPINFANFLPRGCVLRNTGWILALSIYVGDETKTRLNTAAASGKVSNMQSYLNHCVWGLLAGLSILCLFAATMSALQEDSFKFCCNKESWLIRLGIFIITYYHVVPMSLYVCFEMLKLILGRNVNSDPQMVCPESGAAAAARTSDLVEEMGQVSFIFSDKTGTLTKNEMVFAKACVDGQDLGDFRSARVGADSEDVRRVRASLKSPENVDDPHWKNVSWFFTCLATCHSVQVSSKKNANSGDKLVYQGMSPDEVALCQAAQDIGIVFSYRNRRNISASRIANDLTIKYPLDSEKTFSVLYELEFNSDRKRMSVVVQTEHDYWLITKGADNIMEGLLNEPFSEGAKKHLQQYSMNGLRTLVVASKKLQKHEFKQWERTYNEALNIIGEEKDAKVAQVQADIEQQLTIAGITAVEDCLQFGVPEAIETIKAAGVKLWVLTGDKTETAVDIARSCRLFRNSTRLAYATDASSTEEAMDALRDAKRDLKDAADAGLVLDGRTVHFALANEFCRKMIYELGLASRSCVCCRLTPLQKRNLVKLVRDVDVQTITLGIGDGANDVPMIEGAHVGVAVRGKEGAQAVQVSDVAISQFRFLVPLLLCHGRRAYRRVALYLCYYLYKNVALLMGDVFWMVMDKYQGRIAFPEYLSINYNVFFTSWHILFVLGFDSDVPDRLANLHPELYLVGPKRLLFNKYVFSRWMVLAVYHGCVSWAVPAFLVIDGAEYIKKEPGRFWEGSITAFTILIFIVCVKLLNSSQSPLKLKTSILPTLGAIAMYVGILGCLAYVTPGPSLQPSMKGIPADLLKNKEALMLMGAVPAVVCFIDILFEFIYTRLNPTPLDTLRRQMRGSSGPATGSFRSSTVSNTSSRE